MLLLVKKSLKVCSERAYRIIFLFYSSKYIGLEFTRVLQPCNPLPTAASSEIFINADLKKAKPFMFEIELYH
ncbi:MAG: hypothetical protein AYK19_08085 [Theionarchaea archaeon DG-70-1]|nr:MAG: hypothetical protein AYK19_08085 [Theionarchaea archaeon DG-70-1]